MSFAPVYDDRSRALILGTWPSPKSREMAFYYGHPQNRFWPLLAALTGEPLPVREDIAAKKQLLLRHGLALVFVVLCAVLPVYKLWALLVALGGAAVAFGVAKKTCPPRVVEHEVPFHTGVEDVDQMLTDIQQKLDTLHALNEALPDPQLSAAMTRMEKAGRSIVEAVEANPAKAKQVRRFANYYLPDAVNVLQQYAKLAKQGVRGENAAAIRAEVEHNAASIATAFENQLDALYAAESMDLSADLTVLQNMLKGQGLSK